MLDASALVDKNPYEAEEQTAVCVACRARTPLAVYLANDYLCEKCVGLPWPRVMKGLP